MIIDRKMRNKTIGGGKRRSPALLHCKITACRVGRKRNIIMWIERQEKEEGDQENRTTKQ
jgi:hypothetical protein